MKAKTVNFLNRYHQRRSIEKNKLAYLAGLIDGEGYIKIEKWGTVRIIIGMTARKVIYWCKTNYGGMVNMEQITKGGKRFYVWRMNRSLEVLKLMILIYPFLIYKKRLVLKALRLLQQRLTKQKTFEVLRGLEF